jgi:hypothetical protein
MASGFQLDKGFEYNLAHTRGTLNPIGNVVRRKTDQIARKAKALAQVEAKAATELEAHAAASKYRTSGRRPYAEMKGLAWALQTYADAIYPTMRGADDGEDSTTGRVVAMYSGSEAIEFGGVDTNIELGNTGEYLDVQAHAILRRAVNE